MDTDTDTDTDTDIDTDTDTDTGSDTEKDTHTDPAVETDTQTGSETVVDSDTILDTLRETDTSCHPDACGSDSFCNGDGDVVCTNECGQEMLMDDCVSASSHGACEAGVCGCAVGYEGEHCDTCVVTQGGTEVCDDVDNNCDGETDEGFDLVSDPSRCGGCNNVCATMNFLWPEYGSTVPEHVTDFGCEGSVCQVGACELGYTDDSRTVDVRECTVRVKKIATGANHSCALLTNGIVKCWGANGAGQLGFNSGAADVTTPEEVTALTALEVPVADIDVGMMHTCAALEGGRLFCWGVNGSGALGVDTGTQSAVATPTEVTACGGPVKSVSLGSNHTCVLREDGQAVCWGSNSSGQLGFDTGADSMTKVPGAVVGLDAAVASISTGDYHTCAVLEDGRLFCWGGNSTGELGVDIVGATSTFVPTELSSMGSPIAEVSAGGGGHTCARPENGAVYCWGRASEGQLGYEIEEGYYYGSPSQVQPIGSTVKRISAGGDSHTCALTDDSRLLCWGSNSEGQLGLIAEEGPVVTPTTVDALDSPAAQIDLGGDHTCALLENGQVYCWGANADGRLGNGTTLSDPAAVLSLP